MCLIGAGVCQPPQNAWPGQARLAKHFTVVCMASPSKTTPMQLAQSSGRPPAAFSIRIACIRVHAHEWNNVDITHIYL